MTAEECIKRFRAQLSTKYPDRYDVDGNVDLDNRNLTELPIPFGVVTGHFNCYTNNLTSLYNAPILLGSSFRCYYNKLTTLDHLPKYIGGNLYCRENLFQNLNALKDVTIKGVIWFSHRTENELDYWIKALYNTDLDTLEYHYDNHTYGFLAKGLKNYIKDVLEEIIKIKRIKKDLYKTI